VSQPRPIGRGRNPQCRWQALLKPNGYRRKVSNVYTYRIEVTIPLRDDNTLLDRVVYDPHVPAGQCNYCDIKHEDSLDVTLNTTFCIEGKSYSDAREFVNSNELEEWVGLRGEIELDGEPHVWSIESDDDPCSCKLCDEFGDCYYEAKEGK